MADKYWGAGSNSPPDGNWNTGANWTGDTVPGSGDVAIFRGDDADEDTSCTCNVAIDVAGLTVLSTYAGKLDFADSSYSHSIAGDATFDGSGEVDCGNATITITGHFDYKDQATWTRSSSTVVLSGTGKNIIGNSNKTLGNLTVSGTLTVDAATVTSVSVSGAISITGTLTLSDTFLATASGTTVSCSGTVDGTGTFIIGTDTTFTSMTGTWGPAATALRNSITFTATGTFGGAFTFQNFAGGAKTLTCGTGTRTFTGAVTFVDTAGTYTIADDTNNPSWVFQGSVTITQNSTVTWTKGTGSITLSGTNDQTITTPAGWTQRLEDLTINKPSGRVTLAGGNLYVDTLTHQSGDLDLDGHVIDSAASVSVVSPARFWNGTNSDMDGGSIVVGSGELQLSGAA